MYFPADIGLAITAAQELAAHVLAGKLVTERTVSLDKSLFIAGVLNAYFSAPESSPPATITTTLSVEELADKIKDDPSIPAELLLEFANKVNHG